jgi:hypothetical protein
MPKYPEFKAKPIKGLKEEDWGKLSAGIFNRSINIDWNDLSTKRTANTDYIAAAAKRDYKAIVEKIDYKASQEKRAANTNYKAKAEKCKKPVNQYDLEGNFIKRWDSAIDVASILNISSTGITGCCKQRLKTHKNYKWEYAR